MISDFKLHEYVEQNVRLDIESFHQITSVQIHVTIRRTELIAGKPVLVQRRTVITFMGVLKQVSVTEIGELSPVSHQIIKFYWFYIFCIVLWSYYYKKSSVCVYNLLKLFYFALRRLHDQQLKDIKNDFTNYFEVNTIIYIEKKIVLIFVEFYFGHLELLMLIISTFIFECFQDYLIVFVKCY